MDYESHFDPKTFLQQCYSHFSGNEDENSLIKFELQQRHNFFKKYSCKWDSNTAIMLEFGCGPIISNLISAAQYVQKIVLAAYLESERYELALWKNKDRDAHDWSAFFKYVVNDLEYKPGESVWQEREEILRNRVTTTSCDIGEDNPISESKDVPFSVICTSYCLTATCNTYDEYKQGMKKLGKLLKRGGYFVLFDVERSTFYRVGERKWNKLYITMTQMKEAMEDAGFDILVSERDPSTIQNIQNPSNIDYTCAVFLVGIKF